MCGFKDKSKSLLFNFLQGNILVLTHSKQEIKWLNIGACMYSKSLQLCSAFCNPTDCSPTGFSVYRILQEKYWSVLLYPLARDAPHLGIKPEASFISCIGRNVLYHYHHLGSTKYWYKSTIFGSNTKN